MKQETVGTVVAVRRQWWLKVNRKALRLGPMDGAEFPHVVKVSYRAEGVEHICRKWIGAGQPVPAVGQTVKVFYRADDPKKAEMEF